MFVCVVSFAVGGYILVNSNFRFLINSEVNMTYYYGDVAYYSISNELKDVNYTTLQDSTEAAPLDQIGKAAKNVNIYTTNEKIMFSIITNEKKIVFSSLSPSFDKNLLSYIDKDKKGYSLKNEGKKIYIQAIRPAIINGEKCYIETIRDVTFVFDNQKSQYQLMIKIMFSMLVLAGGLTLIISKLLMRQVVSMTRVTKKISAGKLDKRVRVEGDDEFTVLSQNFNRMADDLEEKIHELEKEAEKREMFVGAFSHELKTPLTSIIGYSDMLRGKEMDRERTQLCANYIFTEGKRLETLSMRLLDLLVLKNQEIKYTHVDVQAFFDEICAVVSPELEESKIELRVNIEPAIAKFEPELMKTVFINLIDNARKAIDVNGKICVSGTLNENTYEITIQDNGKGMEEKELSKIKEAFYMVDKSRSRKQGGAGLGLSICDQILKLHGFEIKFESTINVGTTVMVTMKGAENEKD